MIIYRIHIVFQSFISRKNEQEHTFHGIQISLIVQFIDDIAHDICLGITVVVVQRCGESHRLVFRNIINFVRLVYHTIVGHKARTDTRLSARFTHRKSHFQLGRVHHRTELAGHSSHQRILHEVVQHIHDNMVRNTVYIFITVNQSGTATGLEVTLESSIRRSYNDCHVFAHGGIGRTVLILVPPWIVGQDIRWIVIHILIGQQCIFASLGSQIETVIQITPYERRVHPDRIRQSFVIYRYGKTIQHLAECRKLSVVMNSLSHIGQRIHNVFQNLNVTVLTRNIPFHQTLPVDI